VSPVSLVDEDAGDAPGRRGWGLLLVLAPVLEHEFVLAPVLAPRLGLARVVEDEGGAGAPVVHQLTLQRARVG
jgi:hypothetical protein